MKCEAVSGEQIFSQARKSPQEILCVFSRALTQHEGKSAVRNRLGLAFCHLKDGFHFIGASAPISPRAQALDFTVPGARFHFRR